MRKALLAVLCVLLILVPSICALCEDDFKQTHMLTGKLTEDGENLFFQDPNGLIGIMDFQGNVLAEARWVKISSSANGHALALSASEGYEIIDFQGHVICSLGNTVTNAELDEPLDPFLPQRQEPAATVEVSSESSSLQLYDETSEKPAEDSYRGYWIDRKYGKVEWFGDYGIIDPDGNMIIPPKYEYISWEVHQYWLVKANGKYGILDASGNVVEECVWENLSFYETGKILPVTKNISYSTQGELIVGGAKKNEFGVERLYIFTIGGEKVLVPLGITYINSFKGGYAVTMNADNRYGLISESGEIILEATHASIENLFTPNGGFAIVDKLEIVDRNGKTVWKAHYGWESASWDKYSHTFTVRDGDGYTYYCFDELLNPIRYQCYENYQQVSYESENAYLYNDYVYDTFSDGLARVRQDGRYGYIDTEGQIAIEPVWENNCDFSQGLARVKADGRWGYIDTDGQVVIQPVWDEAYDFSEGLARVKANGQYGYIDKTGKVVIEPAWDLALDFQEERAVVGIKKDDAVAVSYRYIDMEGNPVGASHWDYAYPFKEGMGIVFIGDVNSEYGPSKGYYGLVRPDGTYLIEPQLQGINTPSEGICKYYNDGLSGYIRNDGTVIAPLTWTKGSAFKNGYATVSKNNYYSVIDREGNVLFTSDYVSDKTDFSMKIYPEYSLAVMDFGGKYKDYGCMYNLITGKNLNAYKMYYQMLSLDPQDVSGDNQLFFIIMYDSDSYSPNQSFTVYDQNLNQVAVLTGDEITMLKQNQYFILWDNYRETWYLYGSHGLII